MTDSRLQELRRAWEASGSVEDEAAYLCERVRIGDLSYERLELAAYMAHQAATMAIGTPALQIPGDEASWLEHLSARWGTEVFVRAVLAAVAGLDEDVQSNSLVLEAVSLAELWVTGQAPDPLPSLPPATFKTARPKIARVTALYLHEALCQPANWLPGLWWDRILRFGPNIRRMVHESVADWALGYRDRVAEQLSSRRHKP